MEIFQRTRNKSFLVVVQTFVVGVGLRRPGAASSIPFGPPFNGKIFDAVLAAAVLPRAKRRWVFRWVQHHAEDIDCNNLDNLTILEANYRSHVLQQEAEQQMLNAVEKLVVEANKKMCQLLSLTLFHPVVFLYIYLFLNVVAIASSLPATADYGV
ncbi:hypothetical protein RUM43_008877 [Polyplax serrata]|uniref:Uncharacterized protein n=1 Tax=Polyplax serrata TaxID=468196 RepID=A0AAN8NUD5_POLSC